MGCTLKNKTPPPPRTQHELYIWEEGFLLSNSFQFWSFYCLFKQNLSFDQRLQLKYLSIYIFLIKKSKSKFIIIDLLLFSQLLETSQYLIFRSSFICMVPCFLHLLGLMQFIQFLKSLPIATVTDLGFICSKVHYFAVALVLTVHTFHM